MISRCAAEVDAWSEVKDGWRPLYGDVDQFGVAVEWHDFRTERSFDWGRSFHPRSLEFVAHFLFEPKDPEFFCMRKKRVARDRMERTKELLARDLANPPSLEMLGQEVGCSPFYLSRIFSREVGLTIPQYLRNIRMERAAELLRSGRFNVTEAAIEVGYSSLSHFSKAFCETIGCCPVLYPAAKHVILDR